MRYFDLHCDTIYRLTDFEQRLPAGENLLQNTGHVDLRRADLLGQYAQVFALFCGYQPVVSQQDAHRRLTRMLDTARSAFAASGSRLRHCTCAADFLEAQAQRQAAAFLSIEGAELLQTEADLQLALQAGVKIVTLTWNFDSVYGCGASTDDAAGLKPAGNSWQRHWRSTACFWTSPIYPPKDFGIWRTALMRRFWQRIPTAEPFAIIRAI